MRVSDVFFPPIAASPSLSNPIHLLRFICVASLGPIYLPVGSHVLVIEFIIQAYGAVLSPLPGGPGVQGNLSRAMGSVVGTACLRAETHVGPQLISHVFGLLKARDVEGLNEEDYWLSTDEGTEWVIRTIDEILDVVQPESAVPEQVNAKL